MLGNHLKNTYSKGFTLIELLVVIAIIGLLASVVLASLNSARAKGADAAIRSSLNNARAQAELYYDGNSNSYASVCTTTSTSNPGIIAMHDGAADVAGGAGFVACGNSTTEWAMKARLVSDPTQYYCVDSSGDSKIVTGGYSDTAVTACP